MYKVMIKRVVPPGKEKELNELITQLRMAVSGQGGYISGETLKNTERPNEYLVISIWDREEDWKCWLASEERKTIQGKIDTLLGAPTVYETYQYPYMPHSD
jgi:heme oxygenase (mycobilin-producing)